MKHCRMGWKRWAAFVFMVLLLTPMIIFATYQLLSGAPLSQITRAYMLLGSIGFTGVLVYLILHILYFGPMGIDYDHEKIVFHLSKKSVRTYRWEELAPENIYLTRAYVGYIFIFPDKKNYVINSTMVGYHELIAMLTLKDIFRKTGLPVSFTNADGSIISKIFQTLFGDGAK